MWGAIIAGVVALASAIISSSSSKNQMRRTNAANMELAQYQAKTNEALIDKQNAYNSPVAQMGRFDAAGLNPNLMYGQGSPGLQTSPARYEAPRVDMHFQPFQIPEVLGMYQDYQLKDAQIQQVEANTDYVRERTMNESLRQTLLDLQGKKGGIDLKTLEELAPYQRAIGKYQYHKAGLEVQKLSGDITLQGLKGSIMQKQNENLRMQNVFQKYEEQFRKQGITSADNIWVRVLTRMLMRAGIDPLGSLKP